MEKSLVKMTIRFLFLLQFAVLSTVHAVPTPASITVDTEKVVFVADERYLSLGMDSNLIRDRWLTFDFHSVRLGTLAQGLSPAYLRLSGTDADRMVFVPKAEAATTHPRVSGWPFPPTPFNMTGEDWDNINQFCKAVGWRMVFGLNGQLRKGSDWDPTNAIELLEYSSSRQYVDNVDFQLGNEPDLWPTGQGFEIVSGAQLGKDVNALHVLLKTQPNPFNDSSMIVGPDVANAFSSDFVTDFLASVQKGNLHAVTWHHYYGGGELKYVNNYTDPKVLDAYVAPAKNIVEAVRKSAQPNLKVWQGETSSTFSPPGNGIDETFVAGYMLLDKMGLNAKLGIDLFVRQTFYGFWFALVNNQLEACPNYWVARLYKTLVGRRVLDTAVMMEGNNPQSVRMYAHCTPHTQKHKAGTVTVYGMNLLETDVTIKFSGRLGHGYLDEYVLTPGTPGNLTSTTIALNDDVIKMATDHELPDLRPRVLPAENGVVLPSKAMVFYVIPGAKAAACT